jgi:hypothetical protein
MLKNTAAGTWHPILFVESPPPGPINPDGPVRLKSSGHHTGGFEKREDAVTEANHLCEASGAVRVCVEEDILWDGEGLPALVRFLSDDGNKLLGL